MVPNFELVAQRLRLGIRPLNDVVLDEIRRAVDLSGSVHKAAPLLGVSAITLHKRMRDGYSDGRKPILKYSIDEGNKRICTYDWSKCDRAKKR